MNKKKLMEFLDSVLENPNFEGCKYIELGHDIYLVVAKQDDGDLHAKLANNVNYTQDDYDYDWESPILDDNGFSEDNWQNILKDNYITADWLYDVIMTYESTVKLLGLDNE